MRFGMPVLLGRVTMLDAKTGLRIGTKQYAGEPASLSGDSGCRVWLGTTLGDVVPLYFVGRDSLKDVDLSSALRTVRLGGALGVRPGVRMGVRVDRRDDEVERRVAGADTRASVSDVIALA